MKITRVIFNPVDDPKNPSLLGFADITFEEQLVVKGIRLVAGQYGPFLGFPSRKGEDNKFYDLVYPTTKALREDITRAVLNEAGYKNGSSPPSNKKQEDDDLF